MPVARASKGVYGNDNEQQSWSALIPRPPRERSLAAQCVVASTYWRAEMVSFDLHVGQLRICAISSTKFFGQAVHPQLPAAAANLPRGQRRHLPLSGSAGGRKDP